MYHKLLARRPIGNPRRVWKQDGFLLTVASAGPLRSAWAHKSELESKNTRRAVKTCMDAGFDLIGCLWAHSAMAMDIVRTAEALGGKVLYQDMHRFGGMGRKNIFCETNDYQGAIEDTKQWNCIKGYIMWDEPISPEHLEETRRMIDYCERVRPDVLPYTVADPSYHISIVHDHKLYAPYIDAYLDTIDPAQMCFDYYPIGKDEYDPKLQLDNSTMWADLEIVRRAAQKRDIPFWFYYQGHRFPWHNVYYTFNFNMARAMAHAGILHGAKALECYTEFNGFVDPTTGKEGRYFAEQQRLNRELKGLGNTLMALTCQRVIHDDMMNPEKDAMDGIHTSMEDSELLEGTLTPRISVSEHSDEYGNRYLMVLNRDYENEASFNLRLKELSNVYEVSKEDGEQRLIFDLRKSIPVYLAPGDLVLYRIQNADEEPYTIEYYLDK